MSPRRQGLIRVCGTRQAMSRDPPQRRRARARNGVAPHIPAAFCRDARSAGHGATRVARPFRSLQARGFASGMEARQGGDSSAGSVHDSPPRKRDARESHKQEMKGRNRKNNNSNKHSNHRNITSGKNIPDTSQTGRVTGDAPAWSASLPAGASLPGVFARANRRPPPPALYHLCLLP
ncbi:YubN [Escherichia coli]|nr:YubN [Escherichia coli]CAD5711228.1 YubN [Escherichia coli]CAD5719245.1 YubN [Escherichia coli]